MTAKDFAANPYVSLASEKSQQVVGLVRQLPLPVWKNLIVFLALVWICRSLATLFWAVFPVPELEQPPRVAEPPKIAAASSGGGQQVNVDVLVEMELFGKLTQEPVSDVEEKPVELEVPDATVTTKLNLKLQGVIASTDPKHARAIIADGNKQALYSIGEKMPKGNNVKLAKVMEQRVILDNNGRFESLWLYSEEDYKKSASRSSRQQKSVPQKARNSGRGNRSASRAKEKQAQEYLGAQQSPKSRSAPYGGERRSVKKERLPQSISDVVRFSVHREGGKMIGYRIRPGRDKELFNEVGLKTNDVVTAVNGIAVDDPSQIRSVYQSLKTATEAQLDVLRDGQSHSIQISLDTGG